MTTKSDKIKKLLNKNKRPELPRIPDIEKKRSIRQNIIIANFIDHLDPDFVQEFSRGGKKGDLQKLLIGDLIAPTAQGNIEEYLQNDTYSVSAWAIFAAKYHGPDLMEFARKMPGRKYSLLLTVNQDMAYHTFTTLVDYNFDVYKNRIKTSYDFKKLNAINCILGVQPRVRQVKTLEKTLQGKMDEMEPMLHEYRLGKNPNLDELVKINKIPEVRY